MSFLNSRKVLFYSGAVIPVLLVVLIILHLELPRWLPENLIYSNPTLLTILNILFISCTMFVVGYISAKGYIATGAISLLFMGCAALTFGLFSTVAGFVSGMPDGQNISTTVYNLGIFIAAFFHFVGISLTNAKGTFHTKLTRQKRILIGYALVIILAFVVTFFSLQGMLPVFLVPKIGPTIVRQVVLAGAIFFFSLSGIIIFKLYSEWHANFLHWYAMALFLIATGLLSNFLMREIGDIIEWVGRFAQYLGGIYLLLSVVASFQYAKSIKTPLEFAFGSLFSQPMQIYKTLIESVSDAIVACSQYRQIILWNDAAAKMFDYSVQEAREMDIMDVIKPVNHEFFAPLLMQEISSGTSITMGRNIDVDLLLNDNTILPTSITVSTKRTPAGFVTILIIRDISIKKMQEQQRNRLASIVESSHEAISSQTLEGIITSWNKSAESMYGYSSEEIVGHAVTRIIPEDKMDEFRDMMQRVKNGDKISFFETSRINKAGERLDIILSISSIKDKDGQIEAISSMALDITKGKKAEQEIRKLFEAVEQGYSAVMITDRGGNIEYVNPRYLEVSGYSKEEVISKNPKILSSGKMPREFYKELWETINSGKVWDGQFLNKKKNGELFWEQAVISPVKNSEGQITSFVEIKEDITEKKQAEELGKALDNIHQILISTVDADEIMHTIINKASEAIGAESAFICLLEEKKWVVKYIYNMPSSLQNIRLADEQISHGVIAAEQRNPVIINNAETDSRVNRELVRKYNMKSFLVIPLVDKNEPIGILFFNYHSQPLVFKKIHVDFASRLGTSISLSLENARLFQNLQDELDERIRTETALRKSEQQLRLITNSLPVLIAYVDRELHYQFNNLAFSKLFNRPLTEFHGKHIRDILGEKYYADVKDKIATVLSGKSVRHEASGEFNGQEKHYDNFYIPDVNANGWVQGFFALVTDMTERINAEKEREDLLHTVEKDRQQLRAIMDILPVGLFISDKNGKILEVNSSANQIWEGQVSFSDDPELYGHEYKAWWPGTGKRMKSEEWGLARTLKDGVPIFAEEIEIETLKRNRKTVLSYSLPILNGGGDIIGGIAINVDITERKQMENELRHARDELEQRVVERTEALVKMNANMEKEIIDRKDAEEKLQEYANKLEASNRELQDFAYIASHDLQEPLRKIQTFSQRVSEKYQEGIDETGKDYLDRMVSAATRMRTFIADLLDYSRVTTQAKPFTKVDLNKVIKEVLSNLEIRLEQTNGIVKVNELPQIEADYSQMVQLFQNIVGNALKFHRLEAPPDILITHEIIKEQENNVAKKLLQVYIQDNGIGFDEKHKDRIMMPFQRLHTHSEFSGTGIGLAICRKIVERHSGQISATSKIGQGSQFFIKLPVSQTKSKRLRNEKEAETQSVAYLNG